MTYPFTPKKTYLDNSVPKVTADDLMAFQRLDNALTWRVYLSRGEVSLRSTDSATVDVLSSPLMIIDAVTGQHVYCAFPPANLSIADMDVVVVSWPANTWVYVYAYCDNQVPAYECSATPPDVIMPAMGVQSVHRLFKTGDETRRYLGCFYSDAGSLLPRFDMLNYKYSPLDDTVVLDLFTGTAPAWTAYQAITLATAAGPFARCAELAVQMVGNADPFDVTLSLSSTTSFGQSAAIIKPNDPGGYSARASGSCRVPILAASTIYGKVSALGTAIWVRVCEWEE